MSRTFRFVIGLLFILILSGCGAQQSQITSTQPLSSDGIQIQQRPSPTPTLSLPMQITTPTPRPAIVQPAAPATVPPAAAGSPPIALRLR